MSSSQPPKDFDLFSRLISKSERLKAAHSLQGAKIGYVADAVRTFSSVHSGFLTVGSTGADIDATRCDGILIGQALESVLDHCIAEVEDFEPEVDGAVAMVSASSSAAVMAHRSLMTGSTQLRWQPCPFVPEAAHTLTAIKLEQLDPSLAEVYRAAWNGYYSQAHDPRRSALWQLRQTMDHLFGILAPDGAVRNSQHWARKDDANPDAVHRVERYSFAAHRWITDDRSRDILLGSASEMNRTYGRLNMAHQRGQLDVVEAQDAFLAVDDVLRRWVDSIYPWPPQGSA